MRKQSWSTVTDQATRNLKDAGELSPGAGCLRGDGSTSVGLRHRIHSVHGGRAVVLGESEETTLGVSRGPEGGGVGGRPAVSSVCIDRAAGG